MYKTKQLKRVVSPDQVGPGTYLVARRKLYGPMDHYGVLQKFGGAPEFDIVIDKNSVRGGDVISYPKFAQGMRVRVVQGAPPEHAQVLLQRAKILLAQRKPYDPVSSNCEHFAREIVTGEAKSDQVDGLFRLGLFIGVIWLIGKVS